MTDPGNAGVPPVRDAAPPPKKPSRWLPLIALFAGSLIAVILCIVVAARFIAHRIEQLAVRSVTRKEETIDVGSLVTRIRDLNRLETADMRVVSVSTIRQTYDLIPNALAGDELTLYAAGDVIAGVDLSLLKTEDVYREPDGTIVVHLPPPQELRKQVVDQLINERVLVTYARESGLKVDEGELDRAVNNVALQNQLTPAQLRQKLRQDGLDYQKFRSSLRDQILMERVGKKEDQAWRKSLRPLTGPGAS